MEQIKASSLLNFRTQPLPVGRRLSPTFFLIILLFPFAGYCQDTLRTSAYQPGPALQWSPSFSPEKAVSARQDQPLSVPARWLPEHERANPAGHSFLCRVETSLEKKMTVPLWIRAGEMDMLPQAGSGNLYLRVKMLRF